MTRFQCKRSGTWRITSLAQSSPLPIWAKQAVSSQYACKDTQSTDRRQDGNLFLVFHWLKTNYAFDWAWPQLLRMEITEAWNTPPTHVNLCTTVGTSYRALRENWKRKIHSQKLSVASLFILLVNRRINLEPTSPTHVQALCYFNRID